MTIKKNLLILLILSAISAFNNDILSQENKLKIAISKGSGHPAYQNYINWVNDSYPEIEVIDLYNKPKKYIDSVMNISSGLLLSGGVDVHPGRFGRAEDTLKCEIDLERDTLEFYVINYALNNKLPILGICRGMQMMNVAMGGSLIVDIPTEVDKHLDHQNGLAEDSYHRVIIDEKTELNKVLQSDEEIVNSNHHQAVDKLGENLIASCRTSDGIVEGIEWKDKSNMAWFLGVQWHPERLINEKASKPILDEFIKEVKGYNRKN